jgi:hypothetical protein
MNATNKTSRILGLAFLFQFVTSFGNGVFLKPVWSVPDNIGETMLRIAQNPWTLRTYAFLDTLTALGVIFLGAVLFVTLRKQNEPLALTAMGFYILEGVLLAASRTQAFSLLRFSQEYAVEASASLQMMGQIALESMDFVGSSLMMLAFCAGALLFYTLLDRARIVPRWLSLWGLIAVVPCLVGTLASIFGYQLPFAIYLPYVPFEFVIAIWILVKGVREPKVI